jgi:hypothetical protein
VGSAAIRSGVVNVAVLLVAVMVGGCSFATMHTPHGSPPECSESSGPPIADIAIAVASPFVAYAILSADADPHEDPDFQGIDRFIRGIAAVGVSFPVWAITGSSSIYGFIKANQCSRAKSAYRQLMAAPPGPGPYPPAPYPQAPYPPAPYPPASAPAPYPPASAPAPYPPPAPAPAP